MQPLLWDSNPCDKIFPMKKAQIQALKQPNRLGGTHMKILNKDAQTKLLYKTDWLVENTTMNLPSAPWQSSMRQRENTSL